MSVENETQTVLLATDQRGYLAWAGRPTSNLTGACGKTAFSGRSGSAQQYKRLSSDTRLQKLILTRPLPLKKYQELPGTGRKPNGKPPRPRNAKSICPMQQSK